MKKIITIIIVLAAGGLAFATTRGERVETVHNITKDTYVKAAAILNRDGDGDDLKDWEEELWKTDPKNADTDGDGTEDGEEIRLKRNPLAAGPDDALDTATVEAKINAGAPEQPETATDRLSREFFGNYLELRKQNGGNIAPEDVERLVTGALEQNKAEVKTAQFDATDITLTGSSPEALREYANGVGAVLLANSPPDLESEFDILQEALESENPDALKRLDEHRRLYQAVVAGLQKLPAPANAAELHVKLLNGFQGLYDADTALQRLWQDPLAALPSIPLFQEKAAAMASALNGLRELLKQNGIRYAETDSGYLVESFEL